MTATQMVNDEISKAAIDLSDRMDEEPATETNVMPLASVTELDVTAFLPATDDATNDLDDTSVHGDETAQFSIDDETVKMPANDEDLTVELQLKSGKRDTKAS